MAESSAWPTARAVSYDAPAIVGKANTGQSGMITGLAPWLRQASGSLDGTSSGMAGSGGASGSQWYKGAMDANNAANASRVQSANDAIAAQKAQAELLRQQEAQRMQTQGAYFDDQSGSWLMSPGYNYHSKVYSNGEPVYEGRSGDE